ncbi:MAG: SIR2 family protein [Nitrospira sp.]|nr:SIR2 family protein [Nitrospira sp.]
MQPPTNAETVIVLGAGATKAFLPDAPLAVDDYNLNGLKERFEHFPHVRTLLELEGARHQNGRIDIEQLMTRLHGRMPYDSDDDMSQQAHLLSEITKEFINRIRRAKEGQFYKNDLSVFGRKCVNDRITCITFNYDDVLDQALWEIETEYTPTIRTTLRDPYWHPDGGYGFFVPSSNSTVNPGSVYMDKASTLLIKLHGSINWYPRKGERAPYGLDTIYHHEDWYPPKWPALPMGDPELVMRHLEPHPFFIPPVLDKTSLAGEPILQLVWSLAKKCLSNASRVYFVGYSMPVTDLAARFLFKESLDGHSEVIHVVNFAKCEQEKAHIRSAYRTVFKELKDDQFEFDGALKWGQQFTV